MGTYHDILAEVGLRINALTGTTATALNTVYNTRPLTTTQWRSARFPFASAKDAILNAESMIAQAVAETSQHEWRKYLLDTTASLASAAALPTAISSADIIGVCGDVRDATSARKLTEKGFQEIQRKSNAFFTRDVYFYTITSSRRIYHTRTNVVVDFCTYSRDDQSALFDSDDATLFPALAQPLYITGALSMLSRDGRFAEQAMICGQYFNQALKEIAQGRTSFAPIPEPPAVSPNA